MLHAITTVAFILHVAGGTVGLLSGIVAIVAPKGGRVHRAAGTVFFGSMLVMAVFAGYLGVVMPGQIVNLVIATFAFYLVFTGWMTARRGEKVVGWPERVAMVAALIIAAPFLILSFQLATGMTPFVKSAYAFKGAILIAIYSFTVVIAIAAISDVVVVLTGGVSGAARIARHLWRMCLGLTLATGSAFTNGLPRLLPGPLHVPAAFFFPQFIPLLLLVFWMIRVRLMGWKRSAKDKGDEANGAEQALRQGAQLLAEKLVPLGFKFEITSSGHSSGGDFAEGRFRKGDRQLRLAVRNGLGLVSYRKGRLELGHDDFMRALGLHGASRYPSAWSEDRVSAFADLRADLENCGAFLEGSGSRFADLARAYAKPPAGFAALN